MFSNCFLGENVNISTIKVAQCVAIFGLFYSKKFAKTFKDWPNGEIVPNIVTP
jgi:hypothetical protein